MHVQKSGLWFCLFLLVLLAVLPFAVYAQPAVTFYSAYLYQTQASSGFGEEILLQLFTPDGREIQSATDVEFLQINGIRCTDAQQAGDILKDARVIQFAVDAYGQIVRIDFTPLQTNLTGQRYDEDSKRFVNRAIDNNLPVYDLVDESEGVPSFSAPYLADGYLYDIDIYGDGIVITNMRSESGGPYVRALTTAVADGFEDKVIDVTAILSDPQQSFTVTAVSPLGFSDTKTALPGEDTVSFVYDSNREDVVTITASVAGGACWQTTIVLHETQIHTAIIAQVEDAGSSFDPLIGMKLYHPDGTSEVLLADDTTTINGQRYEDIEEAMDRLAGAGMIQFVAATPGYLDAIRFDTQPPVERSGVSYSDIALDRPVFYRYSVDAFQPYTLPHLAEGYAYDIAVSAYGTVITHMSYLDKPAVIQRINSSVSIQRDSQSITVSPVFSSDNVTYTAVLSDDAGPVATLEGTDDVVFEGLPNETHAYTVTLSSEQTDSREIVIETVQADIGTAYLNQYAYSGWEEIAVLEVLDASGKRQLRLTEDSQINGQASREWEYELDSLLRDVKIIQFVQGEDGSIASLWFEADQTAATLIDVTADDPAFPTALPILYLRNLDDPAQAQSLPPYVQKGYTYQVDVYQDAAVIRAMQYANGDSMVVSFGAVAMPGLYEQSVEAWAEFDGPVEEYTAQLWEGGNLLETQQVARDGAAVFSHLPDTAHGYTVRFFADGSDVRETTVETAQINRGWAVVSVISEVVSEEQGTVQTVASVMENGAVHTYVFHPDATLPDGSPVIHGQDVNRADSADGMFRQPVLFSLNENQEITRMRYAQPAVTTHVTQSGGQTRLSYVLTLLNADTAQQQSATPCAAVYCGDQLVGIRVYDAMPAGEDCVVSDTVVLDGSVQQDEPLTVKAIWLDDLEHLHPLSAREID